MKLNKTALAMATLNSFIASLMTWGDSLTRGVGKKTVIVLEQPLLGYGAIPLWILSGFLLCLAFGLKIGSGEKS